MARSRRLLLIGLLIFVIGAGLTLFTLQAAGTGSSAPQQPAAQPSESPTDGPGADAEEGVGVVRLTTTGPSMPSQLRIPPGMEAVAVNVSFPQSVAALPSAGDRVNVYGVFTNKPPAGNEQADLPLVQRVLTQVEILGRTGGSSDAGGSPTYVLALGPDQVERTLLLSTAEQVWLTLTTEDAPQPPTRGASHGNVLR